MFTSFFSVVTAFIAAHPHLAYAAVLLLALSESIPVIGVFIPGTAAILAVSALVPSGIVKLWPLLGAATIGAVIGDGLSFWVGHRYHREILERWPLNRHLDLITRSEAFFARHGDKSVFIARFTPGVRAFIPLIAGILQMPVRRFYAANILSALVWAPSHILPAVFVGAAFSVLGAAAKPLAILVVLVVIVIWVAIRLVRLALRHGPPLASRMSELLRAHVAGSNSHWGRFVIDLLDPARPDARILALLAQFVGPPAGRGSQPGQNSSGNEMRTDTGQVFRLEDYRPSEYLIPQTSLTFRLSPDNTTVVSELSIERRGEASPDQPLVLDGDQLVLSRIEIDGSPLESSAYEATPERLTIRELPAARRFRLLIETRIAPASNQALMGLYRSSNVYCTQCEAEGFRRITYFLDRPDILSVYTVRIEASHCSRWWRAIWAVSATVSSPPRVARAGGLNVYRHHSLDVERYAVKRTIPMMTAADWSASGWQSLPSRRIDITGEIEEPLTIQWAGNLSAIQQDLQDKGWRSPGAWASSKALLWLTTTAAPVDLPAIPRLSSGQLPTLTLVLPDSAAPDVSRLVLRLWDAGLELTDGNLMPVWIGSVVKERVLRPLSLVSVISSQADANTPRNSLAQMLRSGRIATRSDTKSDGEWDGGVLLLRPMGQNAPD